MDQQVSGYIKARMIFIGADSSQGTSVFRGDKISTSSTSDEAEFTAKNNLGKLVIRKIGAYGGNQEYENVANLGFKLYYWQGQNKKYLRINDQGQIKNQSSVSMGAGTSYDGNANNATTIYTSSNGTITIDNISNEYQYYIEETDGSSTNYKLEIVSAKRQVGSGSKETVSASGNIAGPIKVELKGANSTATRVEVTDRRKTGKLTIEKVDKDNHGLKLGNVQFKVKNRDTGCYVVATKVSNGVYQIIDSLKGYTGNESSATVFVTNPISGKIEISGLDVGNYEIIEISNPNYGYTVKAKNVWTTLKESGTSVVIENEKQTGNLKIEKVDKDNIKHVLPGVTFKMKNSQGYLIAVDNNGNVQKRVNGSINLGGIKITSNKNDATEFVTDNNGVVRICDILIGDYKVEEISVGNNFGYELKDINISWESNVGSGTGNPANVKVTRQTSINTGTGINSNDSVYNKLTVKNKRVFVKLSGYVWEDMISQKTSVRNGLWKNDQNDQNDRRVNNVKVTLRKADGSIIDTRVSNTITNTSGKQEEGAYIFGDYLRDPSAKKIRIDELNGSYMEFEYNGMSYESTSINAGKSNGNKATDSKKRPSFHDSYATIVNGNSQNPNGQKTYNLNYGYDNHVSTLKYGGQYKYGYSGQKFPISGIDAQYTLTANTKDATPNALLGQTAITMAQIYSNSIDEIPNVNLGVYEREMPDIALLKDLYNLRVSINGYNHIYKYDQRFVNQGEYGDGFNVGVKFGNKYGNQTYTRPVYKTDCDFVDSSNSKNELNVYVTYKIAIRNEATNLTSKINTIYDYYDAKYTVMGVGTGAADNGDILNGVSYKTENYNSEYKKLVINPNISVKAQTQQYVYVQFKLDRTTVKNILFDANGEENNEKVMLDNSAEVASYSTFAKDGSRYGGIDKDSNPGSMKPEDRNTYEDDSDSAPGLQLVVAGARTITGTVFVDSTTGELRTAQERLGDGEFKQGEKGVQGVKVTMYKENGDKYAETTTDENGNYKISNFIPGKYKLVYTWGDKTYTVDEYKGTIYKEPDRQNRTSWYLEKVDTRYSDAIDNYDTRLQIDTGDHLEITTMDSTTPMMEFGVELRDIIDKFPPTSGVDKIEFVARNIDFGIVERPRQVLDTYKRVSSVKITLTSGQVIADAKVVEENGELKLKGNILNGVTFIPQGNQYPKNGFIRLELDNEIIQGATVEIEYNIVVENNSELDYDSENYYKYGTDKQNLIIVKPAGVYDYIDKELIVGEESTEWEIKTDNTYYEEVSEPTVIEKYLYEYYKREGTLEGIKEITGYEEFEEIYREAIRNWTQNTVITARKKKLVDKTVLYNADLERNIKPGEKNVATLKASKVLSSTDEIALDNDVEIVEVTRDQRTGRQVTPELSNLYDKGETVIITPPTGNNKNYLPFIILGVSCLVILGTGIVFIKKKILK